MVVGAGAAEVDQVMEAVAGGVELVAVGNDGLRGSVVAGGGVVVVGRALDADDGRDGSEVGWSTGRGRVGTGSGGAGGTSPGQGRSRTGQNSAVCPLWTSRGVLGGLTGGTGAAGLVRTLTRVGRAVTSTRPWCCGGGAAPSGGRPKVSTRASAPPSATTGSTSTAEKHPRPLLGTSR